MSYMNIYALSIIFVLVFIIAAGSSVLIRVQSELGDTYDALAKQHLNVASLRSEVLGMRQWAAGVSNGFYGGAPILQDGSLLQNGKVIHADNSVVDAMTKPGAAQKFAHDTCTDFNDDYPDGMPFEMPLELKHKIENAAREQTAKDLFSKT